MSLFTTPDAAALWGNTTNTTNTSAPAFFGASQQPQTQSFAPPCADGVGHNPMLPENTTVNNNININNNNNNNNTNATFNATSAFIVPPASQQQLQQSFTHNAQQQLVQQQQVPTMYPYAVQPQHYSAGAPLVMQQPQFAAPTAPMTLVQLPNGQLVLQPQQPYTPMQMQGTLPPTWSPQPPMIPHMPQHGAPHQQHHTRQNQPQPPQLRRPAAAASGKAPSAHKSALPTNGGSTEPRAYSANGTRSSLVAPSVEPLRALANELSEGLQLRDVTIVSNAPTPIAMERIDALIELTYKSFVTDRDLMVFVKEHFCVELCLQIRDRLTTTHADALAAAKQASASEDAAVRKTVLGIDMIERRGVLTVSLVEVLCTMPTPCSHEEQFEGASDSTKNLTSFCPLTRAVFHTMFDACVTSPRGCIALLRLFSSTSTAPRPVDNMVRQVTARLGTLVFDSHANYIVSHILCTCELSTADPRQRVFTPIPRDEMIARTPTILALAAVNTKASDKQQQQHQQPEAPPLPPRRIATASPDVWGAFVAKLAEVLTADVVGTGTHREASHILEHAIRRFDFKRIPAAAAVVTKLTCDDAQVLLPLAQSTCGRHCVRALAETLATRGGDLPYDVLRAAVGSLRALQARVREDSLHGSVAGFEAIDTALRRLPNLE